MAKYIDLLYKWYKSKVKSARWGRHPTQPQQCAGPLCGAAFRRPCAQVYGMPMQFCHASWGCCPAWPQQQEGSATGTYGAAWHAGVWAHELLSCLSKCTTFCVARPSIVLACRWMLHPCNFAMLHKGVIPPDHSDGKVVQQVHMVQHSMLESRLMSSLEVVWDTTLSNALPSVWCSLPSFLCTGVCHAHATSLHAGVCCAHAMPSAHIHVWVQEPNQVWHQLVAPGLVVKAPWIGYMTDRP